MCHALMAEGPGLTGGDSVACGKGWQWHCSPSCENSCCHVLPQFLSSGACGCIKEEAFAVGPSQWIVVESVDTALLSVQWREAMASYTALCV